MYKRKCNYNTLVKSTGNNIYIKITKAKKKKKITKAMNMDYTKKQDKKWERENGVCN